MAKVLITGTSKGIGYDAALHMAKAGHDVVATMRNPNNSDLAEAASKAGLEMDIQTLDVDSDDSVKAVFDAAGHVDVLVNNAGILSYNAVEDEPIETFASVMNTNFLGTVRCSKAALPGMRAKGAGIIINIGSVAGKIAAGPAGAYSSSKYAIEAFSECLAQDMFSFGGRAYLIEPGIIDTPMATTEFPEPKAGSDYPSGRRMMALFAFAKQIDAPANLVSDKIDELITHGSEMLRHPVGPDALSFLGWRSSISAERLTSVWGHPDDDEFLKGVKADMGIDLTAFLSRD